MPEFTPDQLQTEVVTPPITPVITETVVVPQQPEVVIAADYLMCDFCKCMLTTKGHVYEISDTARDFRDGKETHRKAIAQLNETIAELQREKSKLESQLRELAPKSSNRNKFL